MLFCNSLIYNHFLVCLFFLSWLFHMNKDTTKSLKLAKFVSFNEVMRFLFFYYLVDTTEVVLFEN